MADEDGTRGGRRPSGPPSGGPPLPTQNQQQQQQQFLSQHHRTSQLASRSPSQSQQGAAVASPGLSLGPAQVRAAGAGATGQRKVSRDNTSPPKRPRASILEFTVDLAAALNDPRKGRQPDLLTRDWGDSFVPATTIPPAPYLQIPPEASASHKAKFAERIKRFSKNLQSLTASAAEEAAQKQEQDVTPIDGSPEEDEVWQLPERLTVVPKVYLAADFDLAHPSTFHAVMEPDTEEFRKMDPRLYARILQDRLSMYLDLVEMELSAQITRRSERFFGAISHQEDLSIDVTDACIEIGNLRKQLAKAQADLSHSNLQMSYLCSQRANTSVLVEKLSAISTVAATQSTVQLLLAGGDYVGALDLISTTMDILRTDLTGINALKHLASQLTEIETVINKMMEREVMSLLLDEARAVVAVGTTDPRARPPSSQVAQEQHAEVDFAAELRDVLQDKLTPLIYGLLRQRQFSFIDSYKAEVESFLKSSVKQLVVDFFASKELPTSGQTANPQMTSWADSLRSMRYEEWVELLKSVYDCLLVVLHKLEMNHAAFSAAVKSVVPWSSSRASQESSRAELSPGKLEAAQLAVERAATASPASTASLHVSSTQSASPTQQNSDQQQVAPPQGQIIGSRGSSPTKSASADDIAGGATGTSGHLEDDGFARDLTDELEAAVEAAAQSSPETRLEELDGPPAQSNSTPSLTAGEAVDAVKDKVLEDESEQTVVFRETRDNPLLSPQEFRRLMDVSAQVVGAALEEIHLRCSKLIQARNRDGADSNIPAGAFIEFFKSSHSFIVAGEKVSRRSCPHLRGSILSQAKAFMERFHNRQKEKLLLLLQNEVWTTADVPSECQELVHMLGRGHGLKVHPAKEEEAEVGKVAGPAKKLFINENGYSVVGSLLMFVKMIAEYCKCAQEMPILTADILTKLFDILRFFNKQTCRLVLKAEALKQQVGLKTITAKHLALSAQTLSVIILLIPCLFSRCKELLPAKMHVLLGEFELITTDFVAHRRDIYVKFVAIMDDVWAKCASDMTWGKCMATPGASAVASSAGKLHKVLSVILPSNEIAVVFRNVLVLINKRFREAAIIKDLEKTIKVGMAADVVFYEEKFSELRDVPVEELRAGLADLGLVLPPFINKNP